MLKCCINGALGVSECGCSRGCCDQALRWWGGTGVGQRGVPPADPEWGCRSRPGASPEPWGEERSQPDDWLRAGECPCILLRRGQWGHCSQAALRAATAAGGLPSRPSPSGTQAAAGSFALLCAHPSLGFYILNRNEERLWFLVHSRVRCS